VRVLFCGLGGIGQRHLRNLRSLLGEQLEVHAYRVRRQRHKLQDNLSIEANADLETDYAIIVHTDLASAMAVRPEAVFVCNPSSLHTEIALAAARAGAHVFMEKPVSNTMEGLDELAEVVASRKLVCYVGYNFRFHPGLQRIKALLDEHFFGNILSVQAEVGEYLPGWHKYEDYRQMYASRADQGGGVILSQIHEMDLIYWYFGLPKTILCRGGKLSNLEIDVEDTATSLMQYEGVLGRFPIHLHQDFVQRPPVRTFKIAGDRGSVKINMIESSMHIYGEQGEELEALDFTGFQRNDMFLQQTRHFLDCIRRGEKPQVDLHDGVQSLRLALAARESLASGAEVQLSGVSSS
jgi:predicted dehydrogenase